MGAGAVTTRGCREIWRPTRTSYSPARSTLKGNSTVRVSPAPIANSSVWLICRSTHRLAKYVALELERLVTSTETVAAPPALMLCGLMRRLSSTKVTTGASVAPWTAQRENPGTVTLK